MSQRRGRNKDNVAGERYNSNALDIAGLQQQRQQQPQMPDFMSAMGGMGGMGGGGGMPDMQQMMEMMQKGGMGGGGMPGMPGMPGGLAGMMPNLPPPRPNILYPYGLAQGASVDTLYTFYPNYINSKKTVQEGRRIIKELACEDPIADELSEVCVYLKLPHALEPNKKYPRDWMVSGRIRVRLTRPDGSFENPEIKTRKDLMVKMAELIPKLQSRKVRLEKEAEEAKQAAGASGAGTAVTAATSNKKKGKGKKGRR